MCVLFQMKLMKKSVIYIHTNISYSQRKFKISIKWWTKVICWKIITAQYIYIYICVKLFYIYIYSARKERFGRPIEIFVCPMPQPMPFIVLHFYSYILTFSFIIYKLTSIHKEMLEIIITLFCFLGCWITPCLFVCLFVCLFCFFFFFFFGLKLKWISTVLPIC